jgi:hypothetical protein
LLYVHSKLHAVTNAHLSHTHHGAAVGVGERYLILAGTIQFIEQRLVAVALALDRRDLRCAMAESILKEHSLELATLHEGRFE